MGKPPVGRRRRDARVRALRLHQVDEPDLAVGEVRGRLGGDRQDACRLELPAEHEGDFDHCHRALRAARCQLPRAIVLHDLHECLV